MTARRALVIGGSLGGLLAAHLSAQHRLGRRRVRAQCRRTGEPRRRPWHASATRRRIAPRRHRIRRNHGNSRAQGHLPRSRRQYHRHAADHARHERLGATLPRAARRAAGARLSSRQSAAADRAGPGRRHRQLRRRHARARRYPGRRRRRPLDGPRAILAASAARLCRLRRLARRCSTKRKYRRTSGARFSTSIRSVCRRASS